MTAPRAEVKILRPHKITAALTGSMPAKRSAMRKIKEVLRLKFEAKLSHEKIAAATGMSKGAVTNTVRRAVQKGWAGRCRGSWIGDTVAVIDPKSGEILTARIFVATLGASKYAYAEATWTQTLPDWIGSNIRMLEFFGAVTS